MKPGRQRLLIPGLLLALLVVVAVAAGVRQAHSAPTDDRPSLPARVSVIGDPRVTESSGLAASTAHPGLAYTVNDSGDDARIFAIDIATGRVVGVTSVVNARWRDAEALALRDGKLWIADTGNNLLIRPDPALYVIDEPGPGTRGLAAIRYPVDLGSLTVDVEAIAVFPDRVDLYVKGFPAGYALELTAPLRADEPNRTRKTTRTVPPSPPTRRPRRTGAMCSCEIRPWWRFGMSPPGDWCIETSRRPWAKRRRSPWKQAVRRT